MGAISTRSRPSSWALRRAAAVGMIFVGAVREHRAHFTRANGLVHVLSAVLPARGEISWIHSLWVAKELRADGESRDRAFEYARSERRIVRRRLQAQVTSVLVYTKTGDESAKCGAIHAGPNRRSRRRSRPPGHLDSAQAGASQPGARYASANGHPVRGGSREALSSLKHDSGRCSEPPSAGVHPHRAEPAQDRAPGGVFDYRAGAFRGGHQLPGFARHHEPGERLEGDYACAGAGASQGAGSVLQPCAWARRSGGSDLPATARGGSRGPAARVRHRSRRLHPQAPRRAGPAGSRPLHDVDRTDAGDRDGARGHAGPAVLGYRQIAHRETAERGRGVARRKRRRRSGPACSRTWPSAPAFPRPSST